MGVVCLQEHYRRVVVFLYCDIQHDFVQPLWQEHVLRRRGKGEASFLHCKSPGRGEADVTHRGRGIKGGERGKKRDKREEKTEKEKGEVETGNRGGAK